MSYKRSALMRERMEHNRQTILQSARELITSGGIKDAQIQAIAERAGVSSGLVYRYFENKSQVLIEVLSAAIQHEVQILNSIAKNELAPELKLRKAVSTFVKRAMNSPQLAYALMFEPVDASLEHERFRSKQLIKQTIIDILSEGKSSGAFEFEDLNTAALCVVSTMTYVVVEALNPIQSTKVNQSDTDFIVKQIADFCVHAVKRQGSPEL